MGLLLSLAALIPLNHPGHYIHWHFIDVSVSNVVVTVLMLLTFLGALFIPFPGRASRKENQ